MGFGQIIDRFPGSALDGAWTAVTMGDAAITVADNLCTQKVTTATAGSDAAAIVRTFDRTLGKFHRIACCMRTSAFARRSALWLMNDAGTPAADTLANLQLKTLIRARLTQSTNWFGALSYWDTGGTEQKWNDATKAWGTGAILSTPQISQDDYHIYGFDYDDDLDKVRLFWVHRATGSTFTEQQHGPKLFAFTDWVAFASIRDGSSTTLKLVLGALDTAAWNSGEEITIAWFVHEYADARESIWTNQKNTSDTDYTLKHHQQLACAPSGSAVLILPESRTANPFALGGPGAWDEIGIQFGSVTYDSTTGTYWMVYRGKSATSLAVGIASSSTGLDGSWTKYASNPIITGTATQHYATPNQCILIKDMQEPDSSKRWKILLTFVSDVDGKSRVFLYTASQPDTTSWTRQGILLDADSLDGDLGVHFHGGLYLNPTTGVWNLFYVAVDTTAGFKTYRAYGNSIAVGSLTKDRTINYLPASDGREMTITTASSTSRIVDVDSTSGVLEDELVVYDQDGTSANWRLGRVRKIKSSTQLELYHLMPGISTTGKLRTANKGKPNPTHLIQRGSTWEWWGTTFAVFFGHASYVAQYEGTARWITSSGAPEAAAPTFDWFRTPGVWLGQDGNSGSAENPRLATPPFSVTLQTVPLGAAAATAIANTLNVAVPDLPLWLQLMRRSGYRRPPRRRRYGDVGFRPRLRISTRPVSFDPNQTTALQAAAASGVASNVNAAQGVTIPLGEAIATAVAQNLVVVLGGQTTALGTAVAQAVAQNLAVVLGGQVVVLSPAIATAVANNLTVLLGGTTAQLTPAVATAIASGVQANLGGAILLGAAVTTAVASNLTAVLGGLVVPVSPAISTAIANNLGVTLGTVSVALTPAQASAIATGLQAVQGAGILLGPAVATAVASNIQASSALIVALPPAVATATVPQVLVVLGNLVVVLTPAAATAIATALQVLQLLPERVHIAVDITPTVRIILSLK